MKNKIVKSVVCFLTVLALVVSSVILPDFGRVNQAFAADGDLVIKLHYHREDNNYTGWDVWLWEAGHDGSANEFVDENGEKVATKVLTPGTSSVGFIVRTADWAKDVDKDQFIDIAEVVSGTVHVYVESKVEGYTKKYDSDVVIGVKVVSAKYEQGSNSVTFTMTSELTDEHIKTIKVKNSAGIIKTGEIKQLGGPQYSIKLNEEINMTKNYTLEFDGQDYKINIPSIYSTDEFEEKYTYTGNDLGANWTIDATTFKLWAPTAEKVQVNLYKSGTINTDDLIMSVPMEAGDKGVWSVVKDGDLNGIYYTYSVTVGDVTREAVDPYARTTGVNGDRAMVINLASTNPEGWDEDVDPNAGKSITDAIIYELHIRDLSANRESGIENVGKYLGLTETGTTTKNGVATGLDHIKELGITHLHILPFYDYGSVDESQLNRMQFNWGYDPVNYNVPEGSYSTDPYNGEVRVKEVKEMVKTLHDNGISVVMDVVYNHVMNAEKFCFNQIVPGYFSRINDNGVYSNGSGCGNDTASERSMVRKYIVDSVNYWATEYHIDGFRFDLVGLLDLETMNAVIDEVHKTHPNVIFYGEGWSMNTSATKQNVTMTTQVTSKRIPDMAFFSDDMRDGLKGSVFSSTSLGFVSGSAGDESKIAGCFSGFAGSWCKTPSQQVNYASCHDNNTLMDRLTMSRSDVDRATLIKMNNLAAAIYMTSEGVPFMQAGEEMLRSKVKSDGSFDENSYASNDYVNAIKWGELENADTAGVFEYYKGLIEFRKAHAALRIADAETARNAVERLSDMPKNVVAMQVLGKDIENETADKILCVFNANNSETEITLPAGKWTICVNGETAGTKAIGTVSGTLKAAPISAYVLVQGDDTAKKTSAAPFVAGGIALAAIGIGAAVIAAKKKKN